MTVYCSRFLAGFLIWLLSSGLAMALGQQSDAKAAELWLTRAQQAAKSLNYQGTFVHQRNGELRSFRLAHGLRQGDEVERLEVLDDAPREYLRVNDRVQCLIPDQQLVVIERQQQERFPALLMSGLDHITENYDLRVASDLQRVAGRSCVNMTIRPRDGFRPAYDLCVDQQTGLLLEAQMLDQRGTVLEHIAFSEIRVGDPIEQLALQPSWSTQSWRTVERTPKSIDLKSQGWFYQLPPGYQAVIQVQRSFKGGREVAHTVLTDGLATISIFIEPYQQNLSHHQKVGASTVGAVNLYGRKHESFWIMVVGEAPAQAVRMVAESLVRKGALHNR